MGIFTRLSDIINSNISALLDKAEDPEKMIRMMIQEMEETLVEVRSSTAKVIAEKKTVNRRIEQLRRQSDEWQSKAELALAKDREDLARAALVEKTTVNTTVAMLEDELRKLDQTLEKLSTEIDQLQAKLTDARARQKTLLMRSSAAQSRVEINQKLHSFSIDSAMNKFEYYERKIDLMEGQVDSMNIKQKDLHDEFEELANQEKINLELESIKAKLNKQ